MVGRPDVSAEDSNGWVMYLSNVEEMQASSRPAIEYIRKLWPTLTSNSRHGRKESVRSWGSLAAGSFDGHLDDQDHNDPHILYLPHDFIFPGGRFRVQFYWDSYFIILSLLADGQKALAKGMIENCFYLLDQHGVIIANRKRWASGSQLPFMFAMISELFEVERDHEWLRRAAGYAERELFGYWLNPTHLCASGLSRYHALPHFPPAAVPEITIDHEATWDLSPRFDVDDVLSLLPVDLNCNLFLYETALARWHGILGNSDLQLLWAEKAERRHCTVHELMWNAEDGLFYDYNFHQGAQKKVKSLASYFAMYAGIATEYQAEVLKNNLSLFETDYGLATCDHDYGYTSRQWNNPVGWAPLHWIVFHGLKRYGFWEDALRIALKWLSLNLSVWKKTGKFYEKYDVVSGSHETLYDRYGNQDGFGWTNGVFHKLTAEICSGGTSGEARSSGHREQGSL